MNLEERRARIFIVITFMTIGKAQIIKSIIPHLIALDSFVGAIGYFGIIGNMYEIHGWKRIK